MTPDDLRLLAERARGVEGRPGTRLDEVRGRIRTARRRRQLGAVGATVVAVVLALTTGVGFLALTDPDRTPPAEPAPHPTATPRVPEDEAPSVRRLTYARGDRIHWGDRVVDVGSEVRDVQATDDGVVFVRAGVELPRACRLEGATGGCDALWFTNGSDVVRIGTVFGTVIRGFRIELSSVGSTVVWFESAPDNRGLDFARYRERGEYVAYDTGRRREVRFGSAKSHLQAVYDDFVYWIPDDKTWCLDFSSYDDECRRYKGMMRLETSTGIQTEVSLAAYRADQRSRPRTFTRPIRGESNTPGPVYDGSIGFLREGDRLVADDGGGGVVTARVASTGEPVRLRLPRGYPDVDGLFVVSWLDDDRVVLQAGNDDGLLVCRLPGGRCRATVRGPVIADFAGRG
jgi:hypothetical protein